MYATIAQLKDAIGSTDASDAYLTALLERASAYIDTMTNRSFKGGNFPDVVFREHSRVLWLPPGVSDVTAVKTKATRTDAYTTLDPSLYDWFDSGRLVLPYASNFVAVSYKLPESVPKDIEAAAITIAQQLYSNARQDKTVKSERVGDWSVTYSDRQVSTIIGADVLHILSAYRLRPV